MFVGMPPCYYEYLILSPIALASPMPELKRRETAHYY
jgi:hypothetical protein